ncbi:MAG: hypothetical protein ABIK36_09240 [Pseudomonadota bacterium]
MKKLVPPKNADAKRTDLNTLQFSMSDKLVVRAEGKFAIVILTIGLVCAAGGWLWLL